jgi:hypothetical protein
MGVEIQGGHSKHVDKFRLSYVYTIALCICRERAELGRDTRQIAIRFPVGRGFTIPHTIQAMRALQRNQCVP